MPTMTAEKHRAKARTEYNANLAECPGHQLLATLSDKWVTLVLAALADGPLRYSELSRTVAGATQKMLTQTLRKLEHDGLINRTVTPSVPVRTDYELTELGRSLLPVQRAIKQWAETHIEEVHAARARHDSVRAVTQSAPSSPQGDPLDSRPPGRHAVRCESAQ